MKCRSAVRLMVSAASVVMLTMGAFSPQLQAQDAPADEEPKAPQFRGWQGMRRGAPGRIAPDAAPIDVNGDGQQELAVVNTRKARIEFYRWLPADERKPQQPADPAHPNELPMAPELKREELTLEQLPRDVLAQDIDGDGQTELVVAVSSPNKVLVYEHAKADKRGRAQGQDQADWTQRASWDLLDGTYAGRGRLMLLRFAKAGNGEQQEADKDADKNTGENAQQNAKQNVEQNMDAAPPRQQPELLISFDAGIQHLVLQPDARPSWIEPKAGGRDDWWLMDLDGDGDRDLVEWRASSTTGRCAGMRRWTGVCRLRRCCMTARPMRLRHCSVRPSLMANRMAKRMTKRITMEPMAPKRESESTARMSCYCWGASSRACCVVTYLATTSKVRLVGVMRCRCRATVNRLGVVCMWVIGMCWWRLIRSSRV